MKNDKQNKNLLFFSKNADSLVVLMFGTILLIAIPNIIDFTARGNIYQSPLLFPQLVAILLVVVSLYQLIMAYVTNRKKSEENNEMNNNEFRENGDIKKFMFGIIPLVIYIFLISIIGFYVATVLSMLYYIHYFGGTKWYKALIFTLVTTTVIYFIFLNIFRVPLPTGIFF